MSYELQIPAVEDLIAEGLTVAAAEAVQQAADDFRVEILVLDEPEIGCTHLVTMIQWGTGTVLESFTTDDPYGAVEAAREAQEYTLEERFAIYAEKGW